MTPFPTPASRGRLSPTGEGVKNMHFPLGGNKKGGMIKKPTKKEMVHCKVFEKYIIYKF
jgi:hypothetical protein